MHMNSLWSAPLLTIIIGTLLWFEIGWAGVIGMAFVFVVIPLQSKYIVDFYSEIILLQRHESA